MRVLRYAMHIKVASCLALALAGPLFGQGIEYRRRPPRPADKGGVASSPSPTTAPAAPDGQLPPTPHGAVVDPGATSLLVSPTVVQPSAAESLVRFSVGNESPVDRAPNMIGGFHNSPLQVRFELKSDVNFQLVQRSNFTDLPAPGGRGMLVSENNSAVPRDRYFVHYNHFAGVFKSTAYSTAIGDFRTNNFDVERFTLGFEKTFPERNWSFEVRVPFASTLDPNLVLNVTDLAGNVDMAMGNVSLIFKQVFYQSEATVVSAGLGIETPTARTTRLTMTDYLTVFQGATGLITEDLIRVQTLELKNSSVNLEPYLAALYAPNEQLFLQGFLQVHVPTNRNSLTHIERSDDLQILNPAENSKFGPFQLDRGIRDQVLLHTSLGVGYWLQNGGGRLLAGVAPTLELHWAQTLEPAQQPIMTPDGFSLLRQNPDFTSAGNVEDPWQIGNFKNYESILSATVGATFLTTNGGTLAVGFSLPLMSKADKVDDFQFQLQFNQRFGASRTM